MKTPLKLLMVVCVLAALSSCDAGTATVLQTTEATSRTVTVTQTTTVTAYYSQTVSDDFFIIYETSWSSYSSPAYFMTLLNTRDNVIGKPLGYPNDCITTEYHMPREDLQAIYDAVIKYDIKSLSGPDLLTNDDVAVSPTLYYKITFRLNGSIYSVLFNDAATVAPRYSNLEPFRDILVSYCTSTDEYQSLPPAYASVS